MRMNIKTIVAFAIGLKQINQITTRYSQVVIALDKAAGRGFEL